MCADSDGELISRWLTWWMKIDEWGKSTQAINYSKRQNNKASSRPDNRSH